MSKAPLARPASELLNLEDARKLLAAAKRPEDVKAIRDQAQALQTYARQRRQSLETLNLYGEIKLRGERRLGDLLRVLPKGKGGRPRKQKTLFEGDQVSKGSTIRDQGFPAARAREWQKVASIPPDAFEHYIDSSREAEREITTAGALRLAGGTKIKRGRATIELQTPERYLDAVREALGGAIDMDPASSIKANRAVQAARIYTEEDNGLEHPWPGRVFLHPPRDEEGVGTWLDYLIAQHREKVALEAVALVDAAPERAWFQPLWRYPVCFTDHKIEFVTATGKPKQLVCGSAFVYLGANVGRFQKAFREIGTTVQELR